MHILIQLLDVYSWIIIISALISWFPIPQDHPFVQALRALTEPVYAPIRKILNPQMTGGLDLSPLLILFAISILKQVLASQLY